MYKASEQGRSKEQIEEARQVQRDNARSKLKTDSLRFHKYLKRISSYRKDIAFNIHPKCKDEVNDQWRTQSKKRDIYEPGADARRSYAHSVTNSRTHSKEFPLYEILQSIHTAKLEISRNFQKGLIKGQQVFFDKFAAP